MIKIKTRIQTIFRKKITGSNKTIKKLIIRKNSFFETNTTIYYIHYNYLTYQYD
jgi:hypothetical protein